MKTMSEVLLKKIYYLLHRSLVESRNLALRQRHEQIHDLADTFEIIPSFLLNWDDESLDRIREIIESYQSKYKPEAYDYLSVLNMDDEEFEEVFEVW